MEIDIRLLTAILFITTPAFAQEGGICSYMLKIPREPKPDDFPVVNEEGSWRERPLFPGLERSELCMDSYRPGSATMGSQVIYMEEEIEGDVVIAKLNYNGDAEPVIARPFVAGNSALLGAVVRRIDGSWYLVITQKQDFEEPDMKLYVFNLSVQGEALVVMVSLSIVNIDDNKPMIRALEPCRVPELGEARPTDCVYDVFDADGEISTRFMVFEVESDRNDDQLFKMRGSNIPGDWFNMHMTVELLAPLDFAENPLHIFTVNALDSLPNKQTVTMMVQVQNVESRPPRWVEIFAVQEFNEKTAQEFRVRAIDGDTGINKTIHYRIETEERDVSFRIEKNGDRDGAILYVDPIDRDTLEREVFQLSIIAYKLNDESQESYPIAAPIVIIVIDVNDNAPKPFLEEYQIEIPEETAMTLNLIDFGFRDRDLGKNARYTVHLESVSPPDAHKAFYIAPEVGYQNQTFIVGTVDHGTLDYEDPPFQNIILKVIAIDMDNSTLTGEAMLYINLTNWNDELPIFKQESTTVTFDETVGEGFLVGTVKADDRDIDDRVVHSLMGNVAEFLGIHEDTGDIYVTRNDAFNYHRQNVIFVQVRADDTLGAPALVNTAVTQLVIQLNDINNTPPTLRLPRGSFSTDENVPEGHLITNEISATDPDTTARLEFVIDWESSYATKQGRAADAKEYHQCVEIKTEYPDVNQMGAAKGSIQVRQIRPNVTIDFEMFEVLYLFIRVYDRETVIGDDYDASIFAITIVDLNDNPPVWESGTLEQSFSVREMSTSGAVIGSVLATDIDGPQYNQVRYTIFPREDTPPNLVTIHFYTGQITVETSNAIDADEPPRWDLHYTVIASDKCYADNQADCPPDTHYHDTEGNLTIKIVDTNNKVPQPNYEDEKFNRTVEIYENATHLDFVSYVVATDLDRDELYHTVGYLMNYAMNERLLRFFAVEQDTGLIYVNYPDDSTEVLDRDGSEATHELYFNIYDNFHREGDGFRNQFEGEVRVTVVLLDVNDNAPELPAPSDDLWKISENLSAGTAFLPILHAPDKDEPNTPNSLVGFEVISLIPVRDIDAPVLIAIRSVDTDKGELYTLVDLRRYWGTYKLHIRAYDHGVPQQDSNEVYDLVIRPWNYHAPLFVFPIQNTVIRLSREQAFVSNFLHTTDGSMLQEVKATDEDGGDAGKVTFEVVGNDEAMEFFEITNGIDNAGVLLLKKNDFPEAIKAFELTIEATDGGTEPGPLSTRTTFQLVFIPTTGEPIFDTTTTEVAFIELEEGMSESTKLPLARDLKNHLCEENCYKTFYRISGGNSDGHFILDPVENILSLARELNRSVSEVHTITVAASNSESTTTTPTAASTLTVTVTVREANPRPIFSREIYTAGISVLDTINRELLTVQATHSEGSDIIYTVDKTSMIADPTLQTVQDHAFTLHPETGVLTLNFQPTASMHGMFDFKAVATDKENRTDTTDIRVYLISTLNRVIFIFVNTVEKVEDSKDFIAETFSTAFRMTCNIDQIVPATDAEGIASNNLTEVRLHFIRDDKPVPAEEIELLRSDTMLLREIRTTLYTELLVLEDFFTGISPEVTADSSRVTIYILAGLAALLGFLCIVLLITFIIRTRTLNRRLEALSMTKYGSVDSGLNRVGVAAPGTNKHAAEGSNPVWNETIKAPDFDAISDVSNDSDLIGIEDLPQFRNDYFPRDNNSTQDFQVNDEPAATHGNDFGFIPSPRRPGFGSTSQF